MGRLVIQESDVCFYAPDATTKAKFFLTRGTTTCPVTLCTDADSLRASDNTPTTVSFLFIDGNVACIDEETFTAP